MMMMIAIIGERSTKPVRGMIDRMGAMIGSVNSIKSLEIVLFPAGSNQDMIARAIIANINNVRK
jgi:hypothetical protein